jgi:hypothetical protein
MIVLGTRAGYATDRVPLGIPILEGRLPCILLDGASF